MNDRINDEEKHDIRLIAIDLDGTLFDSEKNISKETLETLSEASQRGIIIMPATGRHYAGVPDELRTISGIDYVLTTNGAAVYSFKDDSCVYSDAMTFDEVFPVMQKLDTFETMQDVFIEGKAYRSEKDLEFLKKVCVPKAVYEYIKKSRIIVPSVLDFVEKGKMSVEKITLNFGMQEDGTLKDRDEVIGYINSLGNYACVSGGLNNVEVTKKSATKGNCMLMLAKQLGIPKECTMAIGDSENDLDMIRKAGIGVAMENAEPEVKKHADYITLSNDENGVAYAIKKLVK